MSRDPLAHVGSEFTLTCDSVLLEELRQAAYVVGSCELDALAAIAPPHTSAAALATTKNLARLPTLAPRSVVGST